MTLHWLQYQRVGGWTEQMLVRFRLEALHHDQSHHKANNMKEPVDGKIITGHTLPMDQICLLSFRNLPLLSRMALTWIDPRRELEKPA